MKKTFFVVSDIHGHYQELYAALKKAGFEIQNPLHKLVICGDLFDRGNENVQVYEYIQELIKKHENNVVVLKGNHELFLLDLENDNPERVHFNYQHNGFDFTVSDFTGVPRHVLKAYSNEELRTLLSLNFPHLLPWIKNLPYYYETKNYIFPCGI